VALDPSEPVFRINFAATLVVAEGLPAAIDETERAIALATAQGAPARVLEFQGKLIGRWVPAGRWDEVLELAPAVIDGLSHIGNQYDQTSTEVAVAQVHFYRGEGEAAQQVMALASRARAIGDSQVLCPALVLAASVAAGAGDRERVAHLLAEVTSALPGEDLRPLLLPEIVRLAVGLGDLQLADRVSAARPAFLASQASAASAGATISEAQGQLAEAVSRYRGAAERWAAVGHVVEHAYALLGLGRSRIRAGDAEGAEDVLTARDAFAGLGARPLVREADDLLDEQQRLSS
jgi:hypothetical protein